jgi:hypothetical protein
MITYAAMFFFIGVKPDDGENTTFVNLGILFQNIWLASMSSDYDFYNPWGKNGFTRLSIFFISLFTTVMVVNLLSMYLQILFCLNTFLF